MSKMIRFVMGKFHRNKDRKQKWKPSKPMEINEPNATTKNLTDLDDDCLEHIFIHLSLEDLLSVVHTNKHLTAAAELAFVRNFGRGGKLLVLEKPVVEIWIDETEKVELINPYRLLRCFGHLISKLKINIIHKLHTYKVLKYVNKYCRETTTEIGFRLCKYFNCVNEPYPNAETVYLDWCYLKNRFRTTLQLNKLFPNVRNLSIKQCNFKREYIAVHFPQLNQLEINLKPGGLFTTHERTHHNMTYAEVLRLNPQLRSLTLGSDYAERLLRFASQHLQSLEHLQITFLYDYSNAFNDGVINFPSLKELKIRYFRKESAKIAISATSLETFSLELDYSRPDMDILFDFLNNHPTITKFNLTDHCEHFRTPNFHSDVIKALPFLEEVNFSSLTISVNDAIRFVTNCKSLKKFCFRTDHNVDVNHLKARAGAKCHVVCMKINESYEFKLYSITIVDNGHSTV